MRNYSSVIDPFVYALRQIRLERKRKTEINKIIENRSFSSWFQPIVALSDGVTEGIEILNRPPASQFFQDTEDFYSFLGNTNLVFAYEAAARQEAISRYANQANLSEARLFINVHPNVLHDIHYTRGMTRKILKDKGMEPEQITFEITEKQAVKDYGHLKNALEHYRKQGFSIAIDDVGAGYNSLITMLKVKPDYIKLDKSLISGIDRDADQQSLVSLFAEYADRSRSTVIAEGIEREEERSCLTALGIRYGQGYYLAKPATAVPPLFHGRDRRRQIISGS